MKKVSTIAAKQIRNFPEAKLTIGLDLGDRSSWYCVLNEAGEVLLEQRLGTTPKAIATARKLAVLLHHLWASGEPYEPLHNRKQSAMLAAA